VVVEGEEWGTKKKIPKCIEKRGNTYNQIWFDYPQMWKNNKSVEMEFFN